jgi:hypothetical protein
MAEALPARERVMRALLAQLSAALAPAGVERNRRTDMTAEESPCLVLWDGPQTADATEAAGEIAYSMDLVCVGTVTAADDASLGSAISDFYARTVEAIVADRTLSDTATDVLETSLDVRVATINESSEPLGFFDLLLSITFRTPADDPYG